MLASIRRATLIFRSPGHSAALALVARSLAYSANCNAHGSRQGTFSLTPLLLKIYVHKFTGGGSQSIVVRLAWRWVIHERLLLLLLGTVDSNLMSRSYH